MATETIEKFETRFKWARKTFKFEVDHRSKTVLSNVSRDSDKNGVISFTLDESIKDYKYIVIEGL